MRGDIFDQPKLIPSGCDFRLRLVFADPSFYLWTNENTSDSKLVVRDASLFIRQVQVSQPTVLAHRRIHEKRNMVYDYVRSEMKTYTIPKEVNSFNFHNVYTGVLPDRIVLMLIEQDAFHGNIKKSPYNFVNANLTSISVYVNGLEQKIENFKFGGTGNFVSAYSSFYEGLGVQGLREGGLITYPMYQHGYTMFVFDLTPDKSGHLDHKSITQMGNLRIHGVFGQTLMAPLTAAVYADFSAVMEIDRFMKPVML
jgi:hypothetical protein